MKLSVVILNYNVRYFLEVCLRSVIEATKHISSEIIVVDNNSPDDSCDMVKKLFPSVQLIENKANVGFSKGNNRGVGKAKGEYVCILNPDTVVPEDAFEKLLEFAESKSGLGILGCQLIDGVGQFLPESKRNIPTLSVSLKKIIGNTKSYYSDLPTDSDGEVEILVGAFMLLKRRVYNEVNGFDEDFFMYGEDIDLSYRTLKKGYKNYYNGTVSILHFKGESTIRNKVYRQRFYGAMKLFYNKHFKSSVIINSLVFIGVNLVPLFKKEHKQELKQYQKSGLFYNDSIMQIAKKIPKPVEVISDVNSISANTLVILDTTVLTFKAIISILKANSDTSVGFRLWPKPSCFILGSDNSVGKGEVILLNEV